MADAEEPTAEESAAGERHARLIMKTGLELVDRMREIGLRPADLFWLMGMLVYNTAERPAGSDVPTEAALNALLNAVGRRCVVMREIGVMEALSTIKFAESVFRDVAGAGAAQHSPAPSKPHGEN